jgi:hypothetical protein
MRDSAMQKEAITSGKRGVVGHIEWVWVRELDKEPSVPVAYADGVGTNLAAAKA